ncbi:MAG TPA: FCD domain-containing protein [Opitutaceae bacterium]|nr:FCD domain-containing protein [Opitutaceae bacterium]
MNLPLAKNQWSDLLPLVSLGPKRLPVVAEICERLLQKHRDAEWLPAERTLSVSLGVSRAALREAIQRLEIQGLLEVRHGIGVRVVNNPQAPVRATLLRALPDFQQRLRQFSEVRVLLEPEIARRAAERITEPEGVALLEVHARLQAAGDDVEAAVRADLEFHRHLAEIAGNKVLALMLVSIADLEDEARRVTLVRVGLPQAFSQHQAIVDAVVAGKADVAQAAMAAHVLAAQREAYRSSDDVSSSGGAPGEKPLAHGDAQAAPPA